jgi:hypothetical protein
VLSEQEMQAIEERANAATEGPWQVQSLLGEKDGAWYLGARAYRRRDEDLDEPPELAPGIYHDDVDVIEFDEHICGCESTTGTNPSDPEFIAHARSDVPALLAEVRRLNALVQAGREVRDMLVSEVVPEHRKTAAEAVRDQLRVTR